MTDVKEIAQMDPASWRVVHVGQLANIANAIEEVQVATRECLNAHYQLRLETAQALLAELDRQPMWGLD